MRHLAAVAALALSLCPAATLIMPVSEVRPGMKGKGLSVFAGTAVEEFGVEVIDVMRRVSPRSDLILCRLSGRGLEQSGVIAGMSGSPVYIDGRLIGAVAYAWGFAKEPIAGVQPIEQMLDIWQSSPGEPRGSGSGLPAPGPAGLAHLPVPLAISGLSAPLSSVVTPELTRYGFMPVAAAGRAAGPAADSAALVPGAAVGVALIDGDVQVAGIGTLTWRDGDRILAFGHPMFQAGAVRLPMTGGRIHTVLPSLALSFKFFSPTAPLGTIFEDRSSGVGGVIGPVPEMTPVTAVLSSPSTRDTFRFRVIRLEDLTPVLIALGLTDAIYQTEGAFEEMTITSKMTVHLGPAGTAPLVLEHVYSGTNPAAQAFKVTKDELALLYDNRFELPSITGVDVALTLTRGQDLAYLVSARPDRNRARPGETVGVQLRLRDYRGSAWEHATSVTIPATAREGRLNVLYCQPDSFLMQEAMRAPGATQPASFAHLKALLEQTGRENELVVAGLVPAPGIMLDERELAGPPPSLRAVLLGSGPEERLAPTSSSLLFKHRLRFDQPISGSARFELEIRR